MKKHANVLITGKDSYVGNNIKKWLEQCTSCTVDELDVRDNKWKDADLGIYDTIIHVAAIVHKKNGVPWELYKKVNTDLPVEIAQKAKQCGVRQFIFFSTMGVYGQEKCLPEGNVIDESSKCNPVSYYARSKYDAELQLQPLAEESFKIAIIRPPNIYGPHCRGNYIKTFLKITKMACLFPKAYLDSRQGLLYIDNLSELVRLIIENQPSGIFTPQDDFIPNTVEIIQHMANAVGKKVFFLQLPKLLEKLLSGSSMTNKLFGGISYSRSISSTKLGNYYIVPFPEGIRVTTVHEKQNQHNSRQSNN